MGKIVFALLAISALTVSGGCETTKGVGRDITNLGDIMSGNEPQNVTY
ncbi:MAG: hypothetical protein PHO00_08525 [bacterium]|nr:hypothetical protein [bacterium]